MEKIEKIKLEIMNSYIENGDLNSFIKKVDEYLENPFFVFDTSFSLLLSSLETKFKDRYIKKYDGKMIVSLETENEIIKSGDLELLKNSDDIIIRKYNSFENSLMMKRIKNGKYTIGYILVSAKNREFIEEDKKIVELLEKIISHDTAIKGQVMKVDQVVFGKIIDGEYKDEEAIRKLLDNIGFKQSETRLMAIKGGNLEEINQFLINKHNNLYSFFYNNVLLVFVNADEEKNKDIINDIKEESDNKADIGISDDFKDYTKLSTYYTQAIDTIRINQNYFNSNNHYYYNECRFICILTRAGEDELEKLIDKRIFEIINYDNEHNSSYLNDIKIYFASGRNIKKAAEELYIHKNSMYYRIDKIKELFKIDLENEEDCFDIEMSIKIISLLNKSNEPLQK